MSKISDGWHIIRGYNVYVEDGKALRAKIGEGNAQTAAYIYQAAADGHGWNKRTPTVSALSTGLHRGTYRIM